jgi:hypothetical protein
MWSLVFFLIFILRLWWHFVFFFFHTLKKLACIHDAIFLLSTNSKTTRTIVDAEH